MPAGFELLGSSISRFAGTLQGISNQRRASAIRTDLIRFDETMFSIYQRKRREGQFGAEDLSQQYQTGLAEIQRRHGVRPGEEALYLTARSGYNRMLEGEQTRRAVAAENAQVLGVGLQVKREFARQIQDNPSMTLEEMDNAAGALSENITSVINPAMGEEARSRVYDQMLASARDVVKRREAREAEVAKMRFQLGIAEDIDRIETLENSGTVPALDLIQRARGMREQLQALPVTAATADARKKVGDLITRLSGEARGDALNAVRLEAKSEKGRIERFMAAGDITASEALSYAKSIERELMTLPPEDEVISLRSEYNTLINNLTKKKVSKAAEQEALQYTFAAESINQDIAELEATGFRSEEDLMEKLGAVTARVMALPEETPTQVRNKSAFYTRALDVGAKFEEQTSRDLSALQATALELSGSTISRDIREGRINTSEELGKRINEMEAAVRGDGTTEEIREALSDQRTALRGLFETITKDPAVQPLIDKIAAEAEGIEDDAAQLIVLQRLVNREALANDLSPEQTDILRQSVINQIRPDMEAGADDGYDREYVRLKGEINHIFQDANTQLEIGGNFNIASVRQQVDGLLENVPEELRRELYHRVVKDSTNKLAARGQDLALSDLREQNRSVVEEKIETMGLDLRDNPQNLPEHIGDLRSEISSSDMRGEVKEELTEEGIQTLLEQHIHGRVLAGESGFEKDPMYKGLDVEKVMKEARRERDKERAQASRSLVDQRLEIIRDETDGDRARVNRDPRITIMDRNRYNEAYGQVARVKEQAADFQSKLDTHGFASKGDAEGYNSWFSTMNGFDLMRDNPEAIIPFIERAGFMTREMTDGLWRTVSAGAPEEANKMLENIALLESNAPDTIRASLSKSQQQQYTYWKYARTRTDSMTDLITRVRGFNNEAQSAVRQTLEREYNKLSVEAEYGNREELRDILGIEDALSTSVGIAYAERDFLELHRTFYTNGMDWDDAEDAAVELIQRDWGRNFDGSLMYLSPEATGVKKLFNAEREEFDHEWIGKQLRGDMEAHGISIDGEPLLFADDQTRRERIAGKPVSYLVRYTREDGVIDFLANNRNYLRFVPSPEDIDEQGEFVRAVNAPIEDGAP